MKIAIGSDHAGYKAKESLISALRRLGHKVIDCGCNCEESCDYPDYAKKVAKMVSSKKCDRGVLVCGTGEGMAMTANKFKNIRAALCWNTKSAILSRAHNDSNVFCAGARLTSINNTIKYLKIWLKTGFEGGRHQRRVRKISS